MAKEKTGTELIVPVAVADSAKVAEVNKLYEGIKNHSEFLPINKLVARPERNMRLRPGNIPLLGMSWNHDTYDLPGMIADIKAAGKIREQLHVSHKTVNPVTGEKGDYYEVLRGYRRYLAAVEIAREGTDANTIQGLQAIPCLVYTGLSKDQEDALINDQTSKRFSQSEVLLEVWRRLRNGWAWYDIGTSMVEQIAAVNASFAQLAEYKKLATVTERTNFVRRWLNNTLNQYWQGVYLHGGPEVRKWLFLTYAENDGILSENEEKAPFGMTSPKWQQLFTAIKEDEKAGFNAKEGHYGPAFWARVEELKKPKTSSSSGGSQYKAKDGQAIWDLANMPDRAEPVKLAILSSLQGYQPDLVFWDTTLNVYLKKVTAYNDNRGLLPAPVREILDSAFRTEVSIDDFDKMLAQYVDQNQATEPEPTEPETETVPPTSPSPETKGKKGKK